MQGTKRSTGSTRASIEVIIRDDEGNIIRQGKAKEVNLKYANLGTTIEGAINATIQH